MELNCDLIQKMEKINRNMARIAQLMRELRVGSDEHLTPTTDCATVGSVTVTEAQPTEATKIYGAEAEENTHGI